jgi:hypothetical protein
MAVNGMRWEFRTFKEHLCDEDWRIAVHEAGHAVFAALNGLLFDIATLHPDVAVTERRDLEGKDCVEPIRNPLDDDEFPGAIDGWQAFYAAGAAAECLLFEGVIREYAIRGDEHSHRRINEKFGTSTKFAESIQCAVAAMADKRPLLEQVALELKQSRKLNYSRVCQILGVEPSWEM